MTQHYFSEDPGVERRQRTIRFEVAGREIEALSISGTFSTTKLDPGTKVLLSLHEHFPTSGDVLDIGCGWGPIAISIALSSPQTQVYAVDINERAVSQTRENAKRLGLENITAVLPTELELDQKFDAIWSNPPIRIGKSALHELMNTYLPRLRPGGSAYLVVQKQLGAESFQKWLASEFDDCQVTKVENSKGYRVIRVKAPASYH
ncbi:MAG: class I SAM-dependent methyltransferase [Aquiluna sp.]